MIGLAHASMACPHFTKEGKEEERRVIIGPIRIFEDPKEGGQMTSDLVIGCNMFRNCETRDCAYSWVSRLERKNLAKQAPQKTEEEGKDDKNL